MQHLLFRKLRSGVTLIEMLIGVAVVGVVLAVAVPSLTDLIERRRVVAAAGEIASIFAQARAESAVIADKVTVHLQPVTADIGDFSCIRMSSHALQDLCGCDRKEDQVCSIGAGRLLREYKLPRSTSVRFEVTEKTKWLGTWDYRVTFDRGGFPMDVSDLFVKVKGVRTNALLHVEYNEAGRVRTCSPDGSITGFPLCG